MASIATRVKTTIFPEGEKYGHLCLVISDDAYGAKIGDADFELATYVPDEPEPYNPDIDDTTPDHQRRQLEAEWEQHKINVTKYLAVEEVLVTRIVRAVDMQHIRALWDEYSEWDGRTCRELMDHLRERLKLTATEKARMREEINIEWDQSEDFEAYVLRLEQIKNRLARWGINIDEPTMIDTAIKEINKSSVFTKEHKLQWDKLEAEDQSWQVLKEHFIDSYNEEERYANETTGRGGLQGINEMNEEADDATDELTEYLYQVKLAATDSKEQIMQMGAKMDVMEAFTKKLKTLSETIASQQKTIASQQATIETLTAKLAGGGNNNRGKAGGGGGGGGGEQTPKVKKKCKNCGKVVYHKPEKCLELPENEDIRMDGWKSVFEGMVNPHYPNK